MAERETRHIDDTLMGEPHIAGRRISVRQVYALVEHRDEDPEAIADRFDLDIAAVYQALAYYHDNPREMTTIEDQRTESITSFRKSIDRPEGVDPDQK